jgi:membrane associated rhomboid family serine protease
VTIPLPAEQAGLPTCQRHPDRTTRLKCVRCDRPTCAECLRDAPVGHQCVDCVGEARRTVRRPVTVAGAEINHKPLIVPLLIMANLALYAITVAQAGSLRENQVSDLFGQWELWPPVVAYGEWWRLVTSGFLHFGPIHIVMNMVALWIIGRDMEMVLGRARFAVVYLVSLLGGGAAVFLFGSEESAVAGASGAVFGLMGGMAVAVIRLKLNASAAIGVIVLNIVISFAIPNISWLGHLGGLVVGAIATAGMVYAPPKNRLPVQVGTIATLTAVLIGLIMFRYTQLADIVCFYDAYNQLVCGHSRG